MAKRGLCILLAVLTVFALAVPAFAAGPEELFSGDCGAQGDNVTWKVTGTWDQMSAPDPTDWVLTISGKGDMEDYDTAVNFSPWLDGGYFEGLMHKVVVEEGVTSIGSCTFMGTKNITSVTLPSTLKRIGGNAFYNTGLTSFTVPAGVTEIGVNIFGSTPVKAIEVAAGNESFTAVDGVLFNAAKTRLMIYPAGKTGASYKVPDSVTEIGTSAFFDAALISVEIPNSVTSIGDWAFGDCKNLTSVTIPSSVKSIGGMAFIRCENLTSMTIPSSVKTIGHYAFDGCAALKSITVLNPDCAIENANTSDTEGTALGVPGTTVVSGYDGSTVEAYAKQYGYTFKSLGKAPDTSKPTELTAPTVKISQTDSGIKVTWNKVDGAPRYMVYYKENGGGWKKIGTTTATSYTRAAKNLKAGATYQFAVRCCDSDKKTLLSGYKASNKVKYVPELAAPTVKISQTDGGIKVTWNKVSGSDRYMVYYKQNGGGWKKIGTTTKTSYTRKASALKAGATYQFAVRCCASDKKTMLSGYKASNKVKYVPELTAPTVKISQTDGGIKVTWNKVSGSAKYMVYYKQNGGSWQKIGTTAKTSYTRAASKLKAGATYQFAVRCCAGDGETLLSGYKASNKVKFTK